jgi:hypothetical protein
VISHVEEAWNAQEFRMWRRLDTDAVCIVEALILRGAQSANQARTGRTPDPIFGCRPNYPVPEIVYNLGRATHVGRFHAYDEGSDSNDDSG